jgi:hypothetical protein
MPINKPVHSPEQQEQCVMSWSRSAARHILLVSFLFIAMSLIQIPPAHASNKPEPPPLPHQSDYHTYTDDETASDVINVIIYRKSLQHSSSEAFLDDFYNIMTGTGDWFQDPDAAVTVPVFNITVPCISPEHFPGPHGPRHAYNRAITDDNTLCYGDPFKGGLRDHVRFWTAHSGDIDIIYAQASYELYCLNKPKHLVYHCLTNNAFNAGRDHFKLDASLALKKAGYQVVENAFTDPSTQGFVHDDSETSEGGVGGGKAVADGRIVILCVDWSHSNSCAAQPVGSGIGGDRNHGVWVGDQYQGHPLTQITLRPYDVSDWISVYFRNDGPGTWDENTKLLAWQPGTSDPYAYVPADDFCHPYDQDWQRCSRPGIPAWIGNGRRIAPGGVGLFTFRIQAPFVDTTRTFRIYFRPAQLINGNYQWIDQTNGQPTYEYFDVTVLADRSSSGSGGGSGNKCHAIFDRALSETISADSAAQPASNTLVACYTPPGDNGGGGNGGGSNGGGGGGGCTSVLVPAARFATLPDDAAASPATNRYIC